MPYVLEILNNVNYEQVISLVNEEATKDVLLFFGQAFCFNTHLLCGFASL